MRSYKYTFYTLDGSPRRKSSPSITFSSPIKAPIKAEHSITFSPSPIKTKRSMPNKVTTSIWDSFTGGSPVRVQNIGSSIHSGLSQVGSGVQNIGSSIHSGLSQVGSGVQNIGSSIHSGLSQVGSDVQNIGSSIHSGLSQVGSGLSSRVKKPRKSPHHTVLDIILEYKDPDQMLSAVRQRYAEDKLQLYVEGLILLLENNKPLLDNPEIVDTYDYLLSQLYVIAGDNLEIKDQMSEDEIHTLIQKTVKQFRGSLHRSDIVYYYLIFSSVDQYSLWHELLSDPHEMEPLIHALSEKDDLKRHRDIYQALNKIYDDREQLSPYAFGLFSDRDDDTYSYI
jgi:hypothetical protein